MGIIFSFFLDMISFNTPQARALNYIIILSLAAFIPQNYLYLIPVRSLWSALNIPSPSIGLTRAMERLMKGDITTAIEINPLIFLVFLTILTLLTLDLYKSIQYYHKTGKIIPPTNLKSQRNS